MDTKFERPHGRVDTKFERPHGRVDTKFELADPRRWGPSGWYVLHRMATHKFENMAEAYEFYTCFRYILPCCTCRDNYKKHMEYLPFPKTASAIPKWVYDMHQRVNKSIGGQALADKAPPFSAVMKIAANHKKEAFFVKCILQTHPGMRSVTAEYTHALHTFLRILTGTTPAINFKSRRQLFEWFKTQYAGNP